MRGRRIDEERKMATASPEGGQEPRGGRERREGVAEGAEGAGVGRGGLGKKRSREKVSIGGEKEGNGGKKLKPSSESNGLSGSRMPRVKIKERPVLILDGRVSSFLHHPLVLSLTNEISLREFQATYIRDRLPCVVIV